MTTPAPAYVVRLQPLPTGRRAEIALTHIGALMQLIVRAASAARLSPSACSTVRRPHREALYLNVRDQRNSSTVILLIQSSAMKRVGN
jgi:hypothetical protein